MHNAHHAVELEFSPYGPDHHRGGGLRGWQAHFAWPVEALSAKMVLDFGWVH